MIFRHPTLWVFFLSVLLVGCEAVSARTIPHPFSAEMEVIVNEQNQGKFAVKGTLYFDGNHTWRVSSEATGPFFLRDEDRHLLFYVLERPLAGVYYHEYDVGAGSAFVPDAVGVDDWTIYDLENPCLEYASLSCKDLGTEMVQTRLCDKWRMVSKDDSRTFKLTRTIWIDKATGITVKSELVETVRQQKRHSVLTLRNIQEGPQDKVLFEMSAPPKAGIYSAQSRTNSPRDEQYTFRTSAKEVLIDASVRDSKGRLVPDLRKENFRIFEDGIERPTLGFWFDSLPIAVALVVDHSASMGRYINEMQMTAAEVLSRLKPQDKVALFAFGERVEAKVHLTADRRKVADALRTIKAGGETDIVSALLTATLYLREFAPESRRVVILVSDNMADSYTITRAKDLKTEEDLIDTALQCETAIYSLRILNHLLPSLSPISMERVVERTGGEMMSSEAARNMLDDVVAALRNRYVLSFRPAQESSGGRLHTIELRLATGSGEQANRYSMTYRRGYRATQIEDAEPSPPSH
jgi:Ca-activated chloride channel homolog